MSGPVVDSPPNPTITRGPENNTLDRLAVNADAVSGTLPTLDGVEFRLHGTILYNPGRSTRAPPTLHFGS
jgi:hypothetical protein